MEVLPIRKKEEVFMVKEYFLDEKQFRNHLLFILGLNSLLRISDLLLLQLNDIFDFEYKKVKRYLEVIEKKTKKYKLILLNEETQEAIKMYLDTISEEDFFSKRYLFTSTRRPHINKPISSVQTYRILNDVKDKLQLSVPRFGNHSLRKTKLYHFLQSGGNKKPLYVNVQNMNIAMMALNHNDLISTLRYVGIMQDDIDAFYLWSVFND